MRLVCRRVPPSTQATAASTMSDACNLLDEIPKRYNLIADELVVVYCIDELIVVNCIV
jgi:hypothetical protein